VLADIARSDPRVVALQLVHNVGQGAATVAGLRCSAGDILITLDDDLQHAPEEISKLLARLNGPGEYDAVFGIPAVRHHPVWRRAASWSINLVFTPVLRKPLGLRFTGFRVMHRSAVLRLLALHGAEPFVSSLLFQVARRIGAVRVEHFSSEPSTSRYSLGQLVRIPLGFFYGLSDRGLSQFALASIFSGMCLLALAWVGWRPVDPDYVNDSLPIAVSALGIMVLAFGLMAAAVDRGVMTFRRKPIATRRMISNGREAVGNLYRPPPQ
jgi:glycosyltransferase involved in cell wall biosynthesis